MTVVFAAKILCDLCYYFYYAGFVAAFFGLSGSPLPAVLLMTLAVTGSWLLRNKGALRFAPLALLLGCLPLIHAVADAVVLIPAAIYAVLTVKNMLLPPNRESMLDTFTLLVKFTPIPLFFAVLLGKMALYKAASLPCLLLYLVFSIFILRLLRHEEEILSRPRFQLMNAGVLLLVCLVCLAFSSQAFLGLLGGLAGGFYRWIISPVMNLLALVATGVGWIVYFLMKGIKPGKNKVELGTGESVLEQMEQQLEATGGAGDGSWLNTVAAGVVIVLCAVAAVIIFKKLMERRERSQLALTGVQRSDLRQVESRGGRRGSILPGSPRQQVRDTYRRFLIFCMQRGMQVHLSDTSGDMLLAVQQQFWCDADAAETMRGIYIRARYSDGDITRQDAREMKQAFAKLKERDRAERRALDRKVKGR